MESGQLFGAFLGKFDDPLLEVAVPAPLATIASASAINGAIQRKMCKR